MSVNLVPEHALPKAYYFEVEAIMVGTCVNRKQMSPEFERTVLLVTPIVEESAQIPLLVAQTEAGV
jgi:hypothetical protein